MTRHPYMTGALAAAALTVSATAAASDAPERVEGVVVSAVDEELIVDLGRAAGLPDRPVVQIWRRLTVTHPITKKTVEDRFYIGEVELARVGERLSIATAWNLQHDPKPGDFVVWGQPEPVATPTSAPNATITLDRAVKVAPDAAGLERAFELTLGAPIDDRIATWETFLEAFPDSEFVPRVEGELVVLRGQLARLRDATDRREAALRQEAIAAEAAASVEAWVRGPNAIPEGESLRVSATVRHPERVKELRALVRPYGAAHYERHAMTRVGDHTWVVDLEDTPVAGEVIEFFVEAVRQDNQLESLSGLASSPNTVWVEDDDETPPSKTDRSRAGALFETHNFRDGGVDSFTRAEGFYRYKIDHDVFAGFTMGVGLFEGVGASVAELDAGEAAPRRRSLSYGFLELEMALGEAWGFDTRVLVGQELTDQDGSSYGSLGLGGELRFGDPDGTRLNVGGSITQGLGNEAWIDLTILSIYEIPITSSVHVTNLPVGEDLGVTLGVAAGYQVTDWLKVMARGNYSARNIETGGLGGGAGVELTW